MSTSPFASMKNPTGIPLAGRSNIEYSVQRLLVENGEMSAANTRADAGETMMIARALEQIVTGNFNYRYPDNVAMSLFAVDRAHDPGAESYTYRQYDFSGGTFDEIQNWASDFKQGSAVKYETTAGYRSYGGAYSYSLQDLRRAAKAGEPLETTLASVVRSMGAATVELVAAQGSAASQIAGSANPVYGFLQVPNVPVLIPSLSASGQTGIASVGTSLSPTNVLDFTTATPEQIAAAFDGVAEYISNTTKGIYAISRAIVPLSMFNFLKKKQTRPTYTNTRLLDDVLASSKFIKTIVPWLYCGSTFSPGKGSDGAGATGAARCLFDDGPDPSKARLVLPVEFEQFAPQVKGLTWTVPCHVRTGGAFVPQPMSMAYLDGFGTFT